RCLEKDRRKRIGDASTATFLLDEPGAIATPLADARVDRVPVWRRALPIAATVAATGIVTAAAIWWLRPRPVPAGVVRFARQRPADQAFTNGGRPLLDVSPDGTDLAYVANGRLWIRSLADFDVRPIAGSDTAGSALSPRFSPDGRSIVYWAAGDATIKRIP